MGDIRSTGGETCIKVNVTAKDIEYGTPMNSARCPIARAVRRAIKNPKADVDVGNYSVDIYDQHLSGYLDTDVITWITMYDRDEPVEPFKFDLHLERS